MNELIIDYSGISKIRKIVNVMTGAFLAGFTLYFCITEGIANRYGILFFCAMAGFILSVILLLSNTLWLPGPLLKIDSNIIAVNLPKQGKVAFDWTSVSRVNIGVSYIVFLVNGEKRQRKLDLSVLIYDDVKNVKAKIVEMCEYKNIPYQND
ncbi:hypothetical protein JGH11_00900 [Dysgonomonas sp. Marseille-P4677]|uniref:hypothetical protein n=1 Tax=Dysgonomonas sp. Marseille-P4677 TaxID=2364790 RepID=UPI00191496F1|nr:hypothetical protein [Dysgonomonas sp. Marseille-P4677]MBK5719418.1 hypothetical protein [Dysgonomonas sp. Marseille-P4677]